MADSVLDTIDRKKQVLTAVESGLKTTVETSGDIARAAVSDPSTQYKLFLLDQLSKSGVGRAVSGATGALFDFVEPVLNQIDRPQNALQGAAAEGMEGLKKGWSQEQDYRFAEALPEDFRQQYPYISETVGGVADIVADPTIVVGGALNKAGQAVIPNSALRGNWAAGAPNYIEGYYGDPSPDVKPTKLERALVEPILKSKGINPTDTRVQTAARKAKGFAQWAGQAGINALLDTLNPAARALYGETGINRSSQRRVQNYVEKGSNRDTQKAVAQAIYNSYMPLQTRRVGPLAPELQEISNYSNVKNSQKMSLEAFKEGADETSFSFTDGTKTRKVNTPKKDMEFAYEYIKQAWGLDPENTSMLFKRPTGSSGNHLSDLAKKSPLNSKIRESFISLEESKIKPNVENLFESLSQEARRIQARNEKRPKNSPNREAGFKVLNPDVEHAKKNGLWLQSSFVGDAVVEGGVNVITKVMPSGRAISFISDVHDFLEKAPVVGKVLGKAFPETNLAVVGPLHQDVLGTKWASKAKAKAGLEPDEARRGISLDIDPTRRSSKEVLEDYVSVRPSAKGVAAETAKVAGRGMMTGGLVANASTAEEEN
jgi:hypothetical protein